MKTKKRFLILVISVIAVLSALVSCGSKKADQTTAAPDNGAVTTAADTTASPDDPVPTPGAFVPADSPVITDKHKALLEKATLGLGGAGYDPVAYVASQTVSGTSHLMLCTVTQIVPGAKAHYALVTVFEDTEGGASIQSVLESEKECPISDDPGGVTTSGAYNAPESPEVTDRIKNALNAARAGVIGAGYEAVAVLAQQMVAGTNYLLLCRVNPVTADSQPFYQLVTLYVDFGGGGEITDTAGFPENRTL